MDKMSKDFYLKNKEYYNRNAGKYEAASWYFFNSYKDRQVAAELGHCLDLLKHKNEVNVLEIGSGTGYLLSKLLALSKVPVRYRGIEHSSAMSDVLAERFASRCESFKIDVASVTANYIDELKCEGKSYDLVMGSSILHHLLDYEEVVERLSDLVDMNGIFYFVREPIHREDVVVAGLVPTVLEKCYGFTNDLLMRPFVQRLFWKGKVKAEDASAIAVHMFKDGVKIAPFTALVNKGFSPLFKRKYNRRVSSLMSYLENKWLRSLRKDIFGNTLFSVGMLRE